MGRTTTLASRIARASMLAMLLLFSGCSIFQPQPEGVLVEPGPEPEPQPDIVIIPPPPVVERRPPAQTPPPPKLPLVAIVLTSGQPAYADIAAELAKQFERFDLYDLSKDGRTPVSILGAINDSESDAVVAIGLRAARSSVAMSSKPVIFSQVFNYQDHNLLKEHSRGIASMAPPAAQLAAWQKVDPSVVRVGAIVGPGHEDLISEAEVAADRLGIDLTVRVTHSDQETLYVFKRMVRNIDGFWLFPDNRILSRRALLRIMDDAERLQVPVLVTSESMLRIGASVSVSSVATDIAKTITRIVREIQAHNIQRIPAITPLSEIRVRSKDATRVVKR